MEPQRAPSIREMSRDEIDRVLARNYVGRIAYSHRDRVDIEPLHYVYEDGWIYGRTTYGTKLSTIERNYWVAFEVDEIEEMFRWRSVVVRGGFYLLSPPETLKDREYLEHAINLLRRLTPGIFTDADPVPERTSVFRIAALEVRGLESVPVPLGSASTSE